MAPAKKTAAKRKAAAESEVAKVEAKVADDEPQQQEEEEEEAAAPETTPPKKRGRGRPPKKGKEAAPAAAAAPAAKKTSKAKAKAAPAPKKNEQEDDEEAQQSNGNGETTENGNKNGTTNGEDESATSIYDFTVNDIKGNEVKLDKYKGNVLLIVNVASKCGHTSKNYKEMVELYDECESKGLRILAFPCNQFKGQEPGNNEKICEFAEKKGVKFDMFDKINVNGPKAHPLYKYLKTQQLGPKDVADISWNFVKFIVDKNGNVVERHASGANPLKLKENLEKYF